MNRDRRNRLRKQAGGRSHQSFYPPQPGISRKIAPPTFNLRISRTWADASVSSMMSIIRISGMLPGHLVIYSTLRMRMCNRAHELLGLD